MAKKRIFLVILAPVLLLALAGGDMHAQGPVPQTAPSEGQGGVLQAPLGSGFTYQGWLRSSSGEPISSTCDLAFSLWDAGSGGTQIGGDCVVTGTAVLDGYFTVNVNSGGEFGGNAFTGEERWLEIAVQCAGDPAPVTLSPRQLLSATPYAHYALETGPHGHWGQTWSGKGVGLTLSGGDGGLSGSGRFHGLYGDTASTTGAGVWGVNTSTDGPLARGVTGESASTLGGIGVYGHATATVGLNYGVYGVSDSTSGRGVYGTAPLFGVTGWADSTDGIGVMGIAAATSGTTSGVYGLADSPEGRGVYGQGNYMGVSGLATATSGTTYGIYGRSNSTGGSGVAGHATTSTGPTRGVVGRSDSTEGRGVYGYTTATSGTTYGLYGQSSSNQGYGVYGTSSSTLPGAIVYGVYGRADAESGYGVYGTGSNYGLWGESVESWGGGVKGSSPSLGVLGIASDTSGDTKGVHGKTFSTAGFGVYGAGAHATADYGVYSFGNFAATGSKAAIVQTQDYGWRHLYAMESPDVLFEDVGTAQLVDGQAVVTIDPIFAQTVNLEQPYQVFLTPVSEAPVLLSIVVQTKEGFAVRGVTLDGQPATCPFHYRIVARRQGYEAVRLAPAEDPELVRGSPPTAPQR